MWQQLLDIIKALVQALRKQSQPAPLPTPPQMPPVAPAPTPAAPTSITRVATGKPPRLDPDAFRDMLRKECGKEGPMPDDYTPEAPYAKPYGYTNLMVGGKIVATYCNYFTRTVCRWFGWTNFATGDRDQAGEMCKYMDAHPETWEKLEAPWTYQGKTGTGPDYEKATELAMQGYLVVAAQVNPNTGQPGAISTGHVCVIAPETPTIFSPKWGRPNSICANVGGTNFYGKTVSFAFAKEPALYRYLGA